MQMKEGECRSEWNRGGGREFVARKVQQGSNHRVQYPWWTHLQVADRLLHVVTSSLIQGAFCISSKSQIAGNYDSRYIARSANSGKQFSVDGAPLRANVCRD